MIVYLYFQTACGKGLWGPDCSNKCHCKNETEICYHVTGSCASGCAERRVGIGCDAGVCVYVMVISIHPVLSSLASMGVTRSNFQSVLPEQILRIFFRSTSREIALRWMPHTLLTISQHWFRQKVITLANVDSNLCRRMASPDSIGFMLLLSRELYQRTASHLKINLRRFWR